MQTSMSNNKIFCFHKEYYFQGCKFKGTIPLHSFELVIESCMQGGGLNYLPTQIHYQGFRQKKIYGGGGQLENTNLLKKDLSSEHFLEGLH